ncbi:uncharacterized protein BKA55DRAFT_598263 [Fusarium redolens]|uniref:Uncharacterized protein n=1 Tax=Fusarium redolens TaxID=48865 RepID=A0A9P9G595_FUSRE|nr:uncharacterized protein BKA55DRAFT_598263 [Fusarium redolens]KAH7232262.1 hypothetical protein BKA55DRAFT_598263 [Fusarium redolens]
MASCTLFLSLFSKGKITDLWRINRQQEEKLKDLEKQNEDLNVKFEATKTRLTRTEITIRALEAKVKLQKAQNEDLKEKSRQQQDEIRAVSELKSENSVQAAKIAESEKDKSSEALGVKPNFSFLQSKLLRVESEYKDNITELNAKNLRQEVEYREFIEVLKSSKEDYEAKIKAQEDDLKEKEDTISKLRIVLQTSESWRKTQSQRLVLLETQVETLEAEKILQDSRSQELEMKYSTEIFRLAQSLEFHFNSTYVKFSGGDKLHTKSELEEAYREAQRLQDKRRGMALARRLRIQEEEDRDSHAYSEED